MNKIRLTNLLKFTFKLFFVFLILLFQNIARAAEFRFPLPVENLIPKYLDFKDSWLFTGESSEESSSNSFSTMKLQVYDSLHLEMEGLSKEAFEMAITGMEKLLLSGYSIKDNILSIVDFSQPSNTKRLYILDLNNYQLLFRTYVAHGRHSGKLMADNFSNKMSSFKSSLGFYKTEDTYRGKHGYSLKLSGLEAGINDNANSRAIVMHGADYVDEGVINRLGFLGRSQGCPAIPNELHKPIIDEIKDGTCLFIYHSNSWYTSHSQLVN